MAVSPLVLCGVFVLAFGFCKSISLERRQAGCDIAECMAPLARFMPPDGEIDPTEFDTKEGLRGICTDVNATIVCTTPMISACEDDMGTQIVLGWLHGVGGYLCSKRGSELLISEATCWERPEFEILIHGCGQDIKQRAESGEDACHLMDELVNCGEGVTRTLCGEDAAEFIGELFRQLIAPIKHEVLPFCEDRLRHARGLLSKIFKQ